MDLPQRKHPRLKHYDYSQNGCYFLTLCTKEKACVLGKVISDANGSPAVSLSAMGETVRTVLMEMADYSRGFQIDHYVIMPNHLHFILTLDDFGGQGTGRPTVMSVVHYLKRTVTKRLGSSIWQPSFYEHVIRNRGSYEEIHNYITGNPGKWLSSPEVTL